MTRVIGFFPCRPGGIIRANGTLHISSFADILLGAPSDRRGIVGYFTPHPRGRPITVITPEPTATPTPTPTLAPLRVYVSGAVQAPDVYLLPAGSLVKDAVLAAGGPAPDADLDRINLARQLEDQQQIYVPRRGVEPPVPVISEGAPVQASSAAAHTLVNINTAAVEELQRLPRLGPADYRLPGDVRPLQDGRGPDEGIGHRRGDLRRHPGLYHRGAIRICRNFVG